MSPSAFEVAMPVTPELHRKLHEVFGNELGGEVVDYFNQLEESHRSELRELFALHFGQFDAKLERRVSEVRAELKQDIAELRGEMRTGFASLGTRLEAQRADLIKWMFMFWAGTTVTLFGTMLALLRVWG